MAINHTFTFITQQSFESTFGCLSSDQSPSPLFPINNKRCHSTPQFSKNPVFQRKASRLLTAVLIRQALVMCAHSNGMSDMKHDAMTLFLRRHVLKMLEFAAVSEISHQNSIQYCDHFHNFPEMLTESSNFIDFGSSRLFVGSPFSEYIDTDPPFILSLPTFFQIANLCVSTHNDSSLQYLEAIDRMMFVCAPFNEHVSLCGPSVHTTTTDSAVIQQQQRGRSTAVHSSRSRRGGDVDGSFTGRSLSVSRMSFNDCASELSLSDDASVLSLGMTEMETSMSQAQSMSLSGMTCISDGDDHIDVEASDMTIGDVGRHEESATGISLTMSGISGDIDRENVFTSVESAQLKEKHRKFDIVFPSSQALSSLYFPADIDGYSSLKAMIDRIEAFSALPDEELDTGDDLQFFTEHRFMFTFMFRAFVSYFVSEDIISCLFDTKRVSDPFNVQANLLEEESLPRDIRRIIHNSRGYSQTTHQHRNLLVSGDRLTARLAGRPLVVTKHYMLVDARVYHSILGNLLFYQRVQVALRLSVPLHMIRIVFQTAPPEGRLVLKGETLREDLHCDPLLFIAIKGYSLKNLNLDDSVGSVVDCCPESLMGYSPRVTLFGCCVLFKHSNQLTIPSNNTIKVPIMLDGILHRPVLEMPVTAQLPEEVWRLRGPKLTVDML
eukprot:gnl/Dysnectes_brevis/5297_a7552_400.p1 GENE.gnl/Dysnectes_brevis/5297_a7552_400~~gnl/Dysnectes_brevis/5297_a7552_400.p1  ORF type:complete len:724 (-),score=145.20 gnl/Dysnectes_brevis/5297_a7552_400:661-2655(-)